MQANEYIKNTALIKLKSLCLVLLILLVSMGRLRFGTSKDSAPFPSAVVVFSKEKVDLSDFGYCIK